jgi:hypothetical protein
MNDEAIREVLNELFSHLERLETQNEAILQFLKEKKRVTDKQLAPYLEQAGNAANVKWRAARVRIDHLLSPEQPEKEAKLGKRPELHEEPAREGASDADSVAALVGDKQTESSAKEDKRTESGDKEVKKPESRKAEPGDADLSTKEKSVPVETGQAVPADGNMDKPGDKSEVEQKNAQRTSQDQHEQKPDSGNHPTDVTEPLARQQGSQPTAQLDSTEKKNDQEAA